MLLTTTDKKDQEAYVETDEQGDMELLKEALTEEFATLRKIRETHWRSKDPKKPDYGDPLKQDCTERYKFWPSNEAVMPLLFLVACIILTIPATSTPNESLHSVLGIILRKQRNSLSTENVVYYTLLRVLLPSIIAKHEGLQKLSMHLVADPDEVLGLWDQSEISSE